MTKGRSDVVSALQHSQMAVEHYQSFINDNRGSVGERMFKGYQDKINWTMRDFYTNPRFPQDVRDAIKNEIKSDVFAVTAIQEKIPLLPPQQREFVEAIIDEILSGKELKVAGDTLETKEVEYY